MSVWLTYSPSDFLLFTPHTYYRLFELYNRAVWPLHIVAIALGITLVVLLWRGGAWRGRAIAAILAACWLWVAWAYLYERYDTINWAARYAASGFAAEAALLGVLGVLLNRLTPDAGLAGHIGTAIVFFALFIQPLLAPLFGRPWSQLEIFGLMPDPTVAATIGGLLAMRGAHVLLLMVPIIWCVLTGATLWAMDAPDALVMPAIAVLTICLSVWKALPFRAARGAPKRSPASADDASSL
jgi:hypothetical protein